MFEVKDIQFSYPNGTPIVFPDMHFKAGEEWLILGPSGCGKTTLLHLLSGLLKPNSGKLVLNGTSLPDLSRNKMDRFRGKHIGIVFQQSHFMGSLTVLDNVIISQRLAGKKRDKQKAKAVLERLGLAHRLDFLPARLSTGERQRASIARAVIGEPTVILADEPTSALDDNNTAEVLDLLREQAKVYNSTLVIVTHDARLKDKISNRIELNA